MKNLTISGISIPDSKLAHDITALIRDTESTMLFNHSVRVYFWGALAAQRDGLRFDPELLYAGAMFHDVGITQRFNHSPLRFEVDGANAARDFLRSRGIGQADIDKVWLAIALHTTPGIPEHLHAEAALVQTGAGVDMAGRDFNRYTAAQRDAVVAAYPRGANFGQEVIDTFYAGLQHRPETTFGSFNDDFLAWKEPGFKRVDLCCSILGSPWHDHPAG